jgi:hypothetical protein|eukprot:TRINITY_DN76555_c0_g1_i1.p1 TRINITY_DN76555_c0_g1~~TRINITY_DN76555_c0_g1_i1.p1  ORF type:complete len:309 (+),score=24.10 TRINITY_DN76555_c0_g1_i1:98-1024(+)
MQLVAANVGKARRVMVVPLWHLLMAAAVVAWADARSLRSKSRGTSQVPPLGSPVSVAGMSRLQLKVALQKVPAVEQTSDVDSMVQKTKGSVAAVLPKEINYTGPTGGIASLQKPLARSFFSAAAMLMTEFVLSYPRLLLVFVGLGMAVAAIALLLGVIYDGAARWLHRARYRACQGEILRVHQAYHSRKGDLALCPCCVEPISSKRSPTKVVFLCGHRFHTECTNKWYTENPEVTTYCPICVNVALEDPSTDGALSFILRSLHSKYPEMITEACLQRWTYTTPEIWLSELQCPRYNSVFGKQHWQCFK